MKAHVGVHSQTKLIHSVVSVLQPHNPGRAKPDRPRSAAGLAVCFHRCGLTRDRPQPPPGSNRNSASTLFTDWAV
jgi:hypothetical protein